MVSVRRPTPRGKRAVVSKPGIVARCIAYGKYAFLGGIVVMVINLLKGGDTTLGTSGILDIAQGQEPNNDNNNNNIETNMVMHRLTPPTFVEERLSRREKEEEEESGDSEGRLSGDTEGGEDPHTDHKDNAAKSATTHKIQYVSPNGEVLEKPEGTGPTKLGYVMDFVHERSHAKFRTEPYTKIETSRHNHAAIVANSLSLSSVQPCEYTSSGSGNDGGNGLPQLLQHKSCREPQPEQPLLVYNAASFPRTWCGVTIAPQSAARIFNGNNNLMECLREPVRLLEQDFPPVSGQGMSPIIIHSQADGTVPSSSMLENVPDCSIPCQHEKDMAGIGRFVAGTDWKFFYSTQDPGSRKEIQVELSKFKHDEYFSTAYFKSDVPLSQYDATKHNLRNRPALNFEDTLDKAVYIVNGYCGGTQSRRTRWFEVLKEQYHVDSYGECQHNKEPQLGETIDTLEGRLAIMKKYKFTMGYEVSTHKDWLTELSYEAMLSGAVPILLGASNANRHFPKNSAIFANDFNSWDKLTAYVKQVATNKTLWESYHTWRNDEQAIAAFERKYQFTKTSPECRLCSWAYAKMNGLGWDHELQQVQEAYIPRKQCLHESSGLITKPFREVWAAGSSPSLEPRDDAGESCSPLTSQKEKKLQTDEWSIVKSIVQHDSVTDITLHDIQINSDDDITLTFQFKDVNNTEGGFFRNSHSLVETERGMLMSSATIQDHKSKITVLANWETDVWSPSQGSLRVVVQHSKAPAMHPDEVRRIRLITEDLGQLHDKMTEYFPSPFSKRMIQDFVDPIEVFYVDSSVSDH